MHNGPVRRLLRRCALVMVPVAAGAVTVLAAGPDVTLSDIQDVWNFGLVGDLRGYAIGSRTCNIGNQQLIWNNNGTPGLAMNAYRLHDGRLMQIGMSWVKHACCAADQQGPCGTCQNSSTPSRLGVGCLDVYSANYNGGQSRLGPRSGINAYSGAFTPIPGGTGNAIFRRLQVRQADLSSASFPGALYFVEGVYVGTDDAAAGNAMNNATYKRVSVDGAFNMLPQGSAASERAAIYAWRDHGLGVNIPDSSVSVDKVDLPGEGRFLYASKARDLGNGTWRYDYAVFNLNSDKAAGALRIPIPAGVQITGEGFHAPPWHSGEIYNNDPWIAQCSSGEVCWRTAQSHAQNLNANALRWGTMYNFWFTANTAPEAGTATLEAFKPHTPGAVTMDVVVPSLPAIPPCYANCDQSTTVPILNVEDFACFINQFAEAQSLTHSQQVTHYANCDNSTTAPVLNVEDFACFLNRFAQGCP
jgi:hypothetical protein